MQHPVGTSNEEGLRRLELKLTEHQGLLERLTQIVQDHDRRVRILERSISYALGAAGLIAFLKDRIWPLGH